VPDGAGGARIETIPTRNAMNEITRNLYIEDCQKGVTRWNRLIKKAGFDFEIKLPSSRFRRSIGSWANLPIDPSGSLLANDVYQNCLAAVLPSEADRAYVHSLMKPVTEPGKMASWIAAPDRGINNNTPEFEYVKLH
jgi:benzoyl-CoA 2,3-dioxygenase component B